jgi:beta-glucanase (GH16 family)
MTRAGTTAALLAALAFTLAACGGGGDAAPAAAPTPTPTPQPPPPPAGPAPDGYRLVWADEFDTPGLPSAARWNYDTFRNRAGWFNNERQYYAAAREANSVVADGKLRITARLESTAGFADSGGQRYTSARLITLGKAQWTYGFFEIRARMPCGQGTWPAIWLLGVGGAQGTVWPDDGEIDIMEHTGSQPTRVLGTIHTAAQLNNGSFTTVPTACTAFHDYQLLWTADEIAIGVDGVVYFRFRNPRTDRRAWPFDAPQYLILNIAIGGTLGGAVTDSIFPVTMEVDHVRVWQRAP